MHHQYPFYSLSLLPLSHSFLPLSHSLLPLSHSFLPLSHSLLPAVSRHSAYVAVFSTVADGFRHGQFTTNETSPPEKLTRRRYHFMKLTSAITAK